MHIIIILFTSFIITACNPPVTYISSTSPAPVVTPEYSTYVYEHGKQTTWDNLLSSLASSDFDIQKLNPNSFQLKTEITGRSDKFIDCGVKTIVTEEHRSTVINAAPMYSYSAYMRNHLETFSIKNKYTGNVSFLVLGDEASSEIKIKPKHILHTDETKRSTRGPGFSTYQQEDLTLNLNESTHSGLLKAKCRSTGKLETMVIELLADMPGLVSPTPEALHGH